MTRQTLFDAALVMVLFSVATTPSWANEQRYAIAVGHNLGLTGEDPLRFAEKDAGRFLETLVELGNVKKKNAILLVAPSKHEVKTRLNRLKEEIISTEHGRQQAVVIFYYAGHGDEKHLHLAQEQFARKELIEHLKSIPAKLKLAVLDACQTPLISQTRGVRAGPSFDVGVVKSTVPKGVVVIQSTQKGEPAHESDLLKGALFTHYWISALRGAGDTDTDGNVTLLEAYTFAHRNTVRDSASGSSAVQHPSFDIDLAGSGDLVLTQPVKADSILVLPTDSEARYLVFKQPSGAIIAEVRSSSGRLLKLAVPSGRLLIQRRTTNKYQVAQIETVFGGHHVLEIDDFVDQPYEQLARRGGSYNLYPNSLSLFYGLRSDIIDEKWIIRQGPRLSYGYNFGYFALALELGGAWSWYDEALYSTDEIAVDLYLRLGWKLPLKVTTLEFCAGPIAQWIYQKRHRTDTDRLDKNGLDEETDITNSTISPGGQLEIGWIVPLGTRFELRAAARGSLIGIQMETDNSTNWQAIWGVGGSVGFGYLF
ncbi:MAG: caspase family protein [Proteobacteria bacterium]|nr:caspase family protein [Pseudomonadota bacterium]